MRPRTVTSAIALGLALSCVSAPAFAAQPARAAQPAQSAQHRSVRNGPILVDVGPVIPALESVDPVTGSATAVGQVRSGCGNAVSPNGKLVAFVMACGYEAQKYDHEIELMNRDGSDVHDVIGTGGNPHYTAFTGSPSFSPDGTRLIIGTLVWPMNQGLLPAVQTIETVRLDGTDVQTVNLGVSGYVDQTPQYSPKRDILAFSIGGALYLKFGDRPARLLKSARPGLPKVGDAFTLSWSPDGRQLVYSDQGTVYEVAVDGSGWRTVIKASAAADYTEPTFSPDGRELAVAALTTAPSNNGPDADTLDVLPLAHHGDPRILLDLDASGGMASPAWLPVG